MLSNFTKKDIAEKLYVKANLSLQKSQEVTQAMLDIIADAISAGRNVELRQFGKFKVRLQKSRVGRNPLRPDLAIKIPPRPTVKFQAGKLLKERIKVLLEKQVDEKGRFID